mmetsp:Transcript_23349/g.67012  ORF Transcript_23349/g.67012 Transcript_23349/m.67012 type:complete len:329 (-) Transcript_23349:192-1178(-)
MSSGSFFLGSDRHMTSPVVAPLARCAGGWALPLTSPTHMSGPRLSAGPSRVTCSAPDAATEHCSEAEEPGRPNRGVGMGESTPHTCEMAAKWCSCRMALARKPAGRASGLGMVTATEGALKKSMTSSRHPPCAPHSCSSSSSRGRVMSPRMRSSSPPPSAVRSSTFLPGAPVISTTARRPLHLPPLPSLALGAGQPSRVSVAGVSCWCLCGWREALMHHSMPSISTDKRGQGRQWSDPQRSKKRWADSNRKDTPERVGLVTDGPSMRCRSMSSDRPPASQRTCPASPPRPHAHRSPRSSSSSRGGYFSPRTVMPHVYSTPLVRRLRTK